MFFPEGYDAESLGGERPTFRQSIVVTYTRIQEKSSKSLEPILPGRDATSLKNKVFNYAAAKAGMPTLKLVNV